MTQKDKKNYVAPKMHVLQLCTEGIIAGSITGLAPDSDDSEFGTNYRRGWSCSDFGSSSNETWNHEWE